MGNFRFFNQLIISLFLFLAACAPIVRVNQYDKTPRPITQGNIEVFLSPVSVPYLYTSIGLITVDDEGWGRSESELLDNAILKARTLGAKAIIILSQDKQVDGYVPVGGIPVAINRRVVRVSAIVKTGEKPIERSVKAEESNKPSMADEIIKLNDLKEKGVISEDEFNKAKGRILNGE